jgi:hypothetical protein
MLFGRFEQFVSWLKPDSLLNKSSKPSFFQSKDWMKSHSQADQSFIEWEVKSRDAFTSIGMVSLLNVTKLKKELFQISVYLGFAQVTREEISGYLFLR